MVVRVSHEIVLLATHISCTKSWIVGEVRVKLYSAIKHEVFFSFGFSMRLSCAVASILIAVCAVTIVGCGGGSDLPPAYSVTGKVTLQGAPLGDYGISFVPAKGGDAGGSAILGSDGSYSLMTSDGRPGCPLGKYKIVLRPNVDPKAAQEAMKNMKPLSKGLQKEKSKVPETFGAAATSPKEVEVKAESNVIDIAI